MHVPRANTTSFRDFWTKRGKHLQEAEFKRRSRMRSLCKRRGNHVNHSFCRHTSETQRAPVPDSSTAPELRQRRNQEEAQDSHQMLTQPSQYTTNLPLSNGVIKVLSIGVFIMARVCPPVNECWSSLVAWCSRLVVE